MLQQADPEKAGAAAAQLEATLGHHPVGRDKQHDRGLGHRVPDRSCRCRLAQHHGNMLVGDGPAGADAANHLIDPLLERRAAGKVERHLMLAGLEKPDQFPDQKPLLRIGRLIRSHRQQTDQPDGTGTAARHDIPVRVRIRPGVQQRQISQARRRKGSGNRISLEELDQLLDSRQIDRIGLRLTQDIQARRFPLLGRFPPFRSCSLFHFFC